MLQGRLVPLSLPSSDSSCYTKAKFSHLHITKVSDSLFQLYKRKSIFLKNTQGFSLSPSFHKRKIPSIRTPKVSTAPFSYTKETPILHWTPKGFLFLHGPRRQRVPPFSQNASSPNSQLQQRSPRRSLNLSSSVFSAGHPSCVFSRLRREFGRISSECQDERRVLFCIPLSTILLLCIGWGFAHRWSCGEEQGKEHR